MNTKLKAKNIIGEIFGFWRVLRKDENYGLDHKYFWYCECKCGTIKKVRGSDLKLGKSRSCGCHDFKNHLLPNDAAFKSQIFTKYKSKAKKRNESFEIPFDTFLILIKKNCFYCNKPPSNFLIRRVSKVTFAYNGIDRIDNSKGYEIDNVVPCCWNCNSSKMDYSFQEFKSWVTKVYNETVLNKK